MGIATLPHPLEEREIAKEPTEYVIARLSFPKAFTLNPSEQGVYERDDNIEIIFRHIDAEGNHAEFVKFLNALACELQMLADSATWQQENGWRY